MSVEFRTEKAIVYISDGGGGGSGVQYNIAAMESGHPLSRVRLATIRGQQAVFYYTSDLLVGRPLWLQQRYRVVRR